jgi:branched-chain amino acid transport system permease protein
VTLARILPTGRWRGPLLGLAALALGLVYTQFLLPGTGDSRGTPAAILFLGLVHGLIISLTAAGIVLIYRTLRIINFAQTAIGAAGAALTFEFLRYTPVPFPIAFVLGLALGGLVGLAFDMVFGRRFFRAPRLVLTVVTIAAAQFVASTAIWVRNIPIFPPPNSRAVAEGSAPITPFLPLRGLKFTVGGLPLPFRFEHIFAIEVAVLALLGLVVFFRFTKAGVAVRAMAENTERASLLGISVGGLSSAVWVLAGVLSAASVTLTGMISSPGAASGFAPTVLLPALAAAVIGRMRNLPVTVAAAVVISMLEDATKSSLGQNAALFDIGLFLIIIGGFLVLREGRSRSEAGAELSWEATEERRPVPAELARIPVVRNTRAVIIAIGLIAVIVYPYMVSVGAITLGAGIALNAIAVLSLVVLTGWAGQVSLGQYGFVAIGAVVGGLLTAKTGIPFWFAVPMAAAFTGGVAVLVGLPALRIKGLFLGVTTFGFAVAVRSALGNERYFGGLIPRDVERPTLFFIDFQDERSMYYLCVAALVLSIVIVSNLRRSRVGRVMIAVRENETNLQSFGVRAVRTKLMAFAISGALAGFAGAILTHQLRGLDASVFDAPASVNLFVLAVIGGINAPAGALLGAAYGEIVEKYFLTNEILITVANLLPLIILYAAPGGVISMVTQVRDAALRIVAQRRQLVVPSLFADIDPDVIANRLIPLAAPMAGGGLLALGDAGRFALSSDLYQGRGTRIVDRLAGRKATKEGAAFGSAARQAEQLEHAEQFVQKETGRNGDR